MQKSKKQRMNSRNKYSRKYNRQNKNISRKNMSGGSSDENVVALTRSIIKEMKSFTEKSIKKSESPIKTVMDELIDLEKNGTIKEGSPKNEKVVMNVISDTVEDIEDDAKLNPKLELKLKDLIDILTKSSFSDNKSSMTAFDIIYAEISKQMITQKEKESEIMKEFKDDPRVLSLIKNRFKRDNDLREKTLKTLKLKRKELLEITVSGTYKKNLFQDILDLFKKALLPAYIYSQMLRVARRNYYIREYITDPVLITISKSILSIFRRSDVYLKDYEHVFAVLPTTNMLILSFIAYELRQRYLKNHNSPLKN
jgi:hypothetical protein